MRSTLADTASPDAAMIQAHDFVRRRGGGASTGTPVFMLIPVAIHQLCAAGPVAALFVMANEGDAVALIGSCTRGRRRLPYGRASR